MMVASISSEQSQTRPTLLPSSSSDKPSSNGVTPSKKPRGRQVSSRYMSPSPSSAAASSPAPITSSRRFPSPLLSRSTNSPSPSSAATPFSAKRAVSADRRRPSPGSAVAEVSSAAKLLVKSTRSLSVSFQGESYSLPVSKTKAPPPPTPSSPFGGARRPTPERRRATPPRTENSKPSAENHNRWPARARLSATSLTRSVDFAAAPDSRRLTGFGSGSAAAPRTSFDGRLSLDLGSSDIVSDTESVSSGSTGGGGGGMSSSSSASRLRAGTPRGLVVSAKFWQETNSRLRRLQDPGSPKSSSPVRTPGKYSPGTGSPGKLWGSSAGARGSVSPCRGSTAAAPSILSFALDVARRGKMGEDRIVEAHMLRLLYNRYLQWRFANARADSASMLHKLNAERNLWNAWVTISELRHSVTLKRIKLLLLRQKLKLTSIIKAQISYLEEWGVIDREHSNSLLGATEALKASTLRLPVGGKTVADIQKLKDAVSSAVDVMQAMGTSICSLTLKAEDMNTLVAELLKVTVKERILLEQSKDFLSKLAAMQVSDCSLKTHIIQFNRLPTTGSLTTPV